MLSLKRVGAIVALAGVLGVATAAPASAYTTDGCYWRVSDVAPFRSLHEEVCFIDFSWVEEKLFPGFVDGEKVMTTYYSFDPGRGYPGTTYGYSDTWWPGEHKNA